MDLFDEVLMFEEKAYQEGYESGHKIARETARKQSHLEGYEHGKQIAKEIGFIKAYAKYVGENVFTERIQKLVNSIRNLQIYPNQNPEEIKMQTDTLKALYKNLLSLLKVKGPVASSSDIY